MGGGCTTARIMMFIARKRRATLSGWWIGRRYGTEGGGYSGAVSAGIMFRHGETAILWSRSATHIDTNTLIRV